MGVELTMTVGYEYNALEPAISEQIMKLHHTKHHQTYVTNLNVAEEKLATAVQSGDVKSSIALQAAIKFNGGGHLNRTCLIFLILLKI